jgi:hypothetical protein
MNRNCVFLYTIVPIAENIPVRIPGLSMPL